MKINFLEKIRNNFKTFIFIFTIWVLIGICLSVVDSSLKYNFVYVIGVNSLFLLEVIAYKSILKREDNFIIDISGIYVDNISFFAVLFKYKKYICNYYAKIVSIFVGIVYIVCLLILKVIKIEEYITIYGIISLIITVYIAIHLYLKYLIYLFFIKKISSYKYNIIPYIYIYNPASINWIESLSLVMKKFSFYFSTLAIGYTFLFYLTTPLTLIHFEKGKLLISSVNNIAFIIAWAIIVIVVGCGYFIIDYFWKNYIKIIVKKIKKNRLNYQESKAKSIVDKNYIDLFNIYKTTPDFPELVGIINTNFLSYIPLIINVLQTLNTLFFKK